MGLLDSLKLASELTGLPERAILTHFTQETGGGWPENNNPANVLYFGTEAAFGEDERRFPWYSGATLGATLSDGARIVDYPSPDAGVRAYAALLQADYGYVLEAGKVKNIAIDETDPEGMTSTEGATLLALGLSPWDGSHYADAEHGPAGLLFATFDHAAAIYADLVKAAQEAEAAKTPAQEPAAAPEKTYTVAPGDSLWTIAVREYGDGERFRDIASANGLTFPFVIHPGDVLKLPTL